MAPLSVRFLRNNAWKVRPDVVFMHIRWGRNTLVRNTCVWQAGKSVYFISQGFSLPPRLTPLSRSNIQLRHLLLGLPPFHCVAWHWRFASSPSSQKWSLNSTYWHSIVCILCKKVSKNWNKRVFFSLYKSASLFYKLIS